MGMGDLCHDLSIGMEELRHYFDSCGNGVDVDAIMNMDDEGAMLKVRDELLDAIYYWSMMTTKSHAFDRRLEGLDEFGLRIIEAVDAREAARWEAYLAEFPSVRAAVSST